MLRTNPTDAAATAVRSLCHAGLGAVREFAWRTALSLRRPPEPDPVLAADWDLLVVLDACRADVFSEVAADHPSESLHPGETRISPASSSVGWLEAVFGDADPGELENLAYVSGNPYTDRVLDGAEFSAVEEVWREGWDDDLGTVPPEPITDRAIELGRAGGFDRLVVHYMQPHFPAIAPGLSGGGDEGVSLSAFGDEPMSIWEALRFGRVSERTVRERYRANLAYVFGEVEELLSNVESERAVITADHGNAIGEYGIYGHPGGVSLPCLREVPWCVTTATDRGTREPDDSTTAGSEPTTTVDERLERLGYRT